MLGDTWMVATAPLTIEQVLILLEEHPPRIAALTAGLRPAELRTAPSRDDWSVNDVLAHLRACADVWGNYIAAIMADERPTLQGMDPRRWMKKTDYPQLHFRPSFNSFARQRADLLAVLKPLPRKGWSRTATVMAWGQPYERTVLFYGQRIARHERIHVEHIGRIVKTLH